jgi:hypothetical protein
VHTLNPATWLSATRPGGTRAVGADMSVTLDQVIAAKIGQETALPSLELCSESLVTPGAGGGYYSTTLSFRDAHTPLPMEFNPRKVFLQLFGEGDNEAERALISRQTTSILDLIADSTKELRAEVDAADQRALDGYLESVREMERRIEKAKARDLSAITLPDAPIGIFDDFQEQVKMMFDLAALAYQANLTRVATYIMVAEGTARKYNFLNPAVPDEFHPLSHHANMRERLQKLTQVQTWHMSKFAEFIDRMAKTPDGDGSLLDHSLFMYGSNMSNSDRHNNYPLPVILVGGCNGRLKGGRHLQSPEHTPIANLHLTVLNKLLDIDLAKFGDSTGYITGA